jgi:hypothetical protein
VLESSIKFAYFYKVSDSRLFRDIMWRWLARLPSCFWRSCEITKFDVWVACSGIMESGCVNQPGGSHVEGADTKDSIGSITNLLVYVVNESRLT